MGLDDLISVSEKNSTTDPAASPLTAHAVLPISSLSHADSPRLAGEDMSHVRLLADSEAALPPILVHRETLRVIDGMHRLRAALLRGEETIKVRFFDGHEDAFVISVQENITHGLPLSLADREAAAARILVSHAQWSDRAVGAVTGLSAKTVGAIRQGVTANLPHLHSRIGRDGRVRPLNGADGRRRASELFVLRPNASLREIARHAGISPATARDVRERMRRGEDPVPPRQRADRARREPLAPERQLRRGVTTERIDRPGDRETILRNLRRDPSVRFTDSGRSFLRWLDAAEANLGGWGSAVDAIPPHCVYVIADLACLIAEEWLSIADHLRQNKETCEETTA